MAVAHAAAALAAALVVASSGVVTALASDDQQDSWALATHSFEKTLTYDDRLGDWMTSAATMALRDRVQILPPVPDRHGVFWNKKAIHSHDFQVTFTLRAKRDDRPGAKPAKDGKFAFWITNSNFSATYDEQAIVTQRNWTEGLRQVGHTFISNRPEFKGFAMLFLAGEADDRPFVQGVLSEGRANAMLTDIKLTGEGQQSKFIDWRTDNVQVKVRGRLGSELTASMLVPPSTEFHEVFRMPIMIKKGQWPDVFMGFTGYSGSSSYVEIDMTRLETRNFDMSSVGEQASEDLVAEAEDWAKVLEGERRYIDQRSQKEAVERLTKLLSDHVDEYTKVGQQVASELALLEKRTGELDSDFGLWINYVQAWDVESRTFDADVLKEHIHGIRTILTKDKDSHDRKLVQVQSAARSLKEKGGDVLGAEGRAKVESVAGQAEALGSYVSRGSTQTGGLLVVLVIAVGILGLLFLNRMRYYEKKHYI